MLPAALEARTKMAKLVRTDPWNSSLHEAHSMSAAHALPHNLNDSSLREIRQGRGSHAPLRETVAQGLAMCCGEALALGTPRSQCGQHRKASHLQAVEDEAPPDVCGAAATPKKSWRSA